MRKGHLDFSPTKYVEILGAGLERGYCFESFSKILQPPLETHIGPVCLLRHDVDADLGAAAAMARLERQFGIRSTYFLMTRSPLYNLMSRANHTLVEDIIQCGHWIGLHFDHGFHPRLEHSDGWIEYEASLLEKLFGISVHAVSFHQPGPEVLRGEVSTGWRVNTYDKQKLAGFSYASDSNRQWLWSAPQEIFSSGDHPKLQLLIHPMWWMHPHQTTEDVWDQVIVDNFERAQQQLIACERAYGSPRKLHVTKRDS